MGVGGAMYSNTRSDTSFPHSAFRIPHSSFLLYQEHPPATSALEAKTSSAIT